MKKLRNFILKSHYFALCLFFGVIPLPLQAEQGMPVTYTATQIVQLAEDYVKDLFPSPEEGQTHYQGVALDKRIKINPCVAPLQISIPGSAKLTKQTTVLLRCPDSTSWSLYVQVKILQQVPIVVAQSTLAPGTVLGEEHLTTMMVDISQIRGLTLKDPGPLLGAKISRFISAGQPVTMSQVCLVCQGDNVTVIAKLKGLRVKTSGISQQSGSLGDNIAILNQRTSKRIKARVVGVNQVEINL